jgi:ribosome biogenesis GTPase
LEATFEDIGDLAAACRFRDCSHRQEPGCAVQEALAAGRLDPARLEAWRELEAEAAALERRRDEAAARRWGRTFALAIHQGKKDKADR